MSAKREWENSAISCDGEAGRCKIELARSGTNAQVYEYGGHVTGWSTKDGIQRLYMSSKAEHLDGDYSLTGGVCG